MAARKFLLFSLVLVLSTGAFAQNTDVTVKEKQERETKLLEQILTDAKNLRLPENRAIVFAKIGSALWQRDEKRARKLFQDALTDLNAAQIEVQGEKTAKQFFQALIYGQSPRHDIINLISARDAELALEFLEKSRPAVIEEAVKNLKDDLSSTLQQYARNEIAVEQRLLGLAAEQNPQTAATRVRESVKKGISYETLNLLKKIHAKDPQTAEKLAVELVESFLSVDFSKNHQTSEAIGYFVAEFGRTPNENEKPLRVSDALLRRLVLKMTDDWLGAGNNQPYGYWNSSAVVEKFFPDRAARLKAKIERLNSQYQTEESQEYTKLMSGDTKPEEMIAQADKFQTAYRNELYRSAAQKFASSGNIPQAEKIMHSLNGEQSEYYLSQFYVNLSYQLIGQGKFAEAHSYINQIGDENQRINALIYLANSAYQRDKKENQKLAEGILREARALIPDLPETQNDFNGVATLANAYIQFDTDEAFRLLESMLPTMNELIQANFVMTKFRNYGGLRQNEFQITNSGNNLGIYSLEGTLRALKEKDFERAVQYAGGINRADARIWLQMHLVDENSSNVIQLPIQGRTFIMYD